MDYNVNAAAFNDNKDMYLKLLSSQLRNQSPLDPVDTNTFMQQLVQFTSVEQQIKTNEQLSKLVQLNNNSLSATAVDFIGKKVIADGQLAQLENGVASWRYTAATNAPLATMTVRDNQGNEVFTKNIALNSGQHSIKWHGKTNTGAMAPSGNYHLSLSGRDDRGRLVDVSYEIEGIVDSIDFSGSEPLLRVNNQNVPLASISKMAK